MGKEINRGKGRATRPSGQPGPVLVHTDGTIFTVDNNSIVLINPTTGQPKFSPIQLEEGSVSGNGNCGEYVPYQNRVPASVGAPIIAGDGYAYFAYSYSDQPLASNTATCSQSDQVYTYHTDLHSRMMKVGADGSSTEINIGDWSSDKVVDMHWYSCNGFPYGCMTETDSSSGAIPSIPLGNLITNADQGVLYSWTSCLSTCTQELTTITNGSPSTVSTGIGGGSGIPVLPILQRGDSSYIGVAQTPIGNSMISFTSSGGQLWSQPNESPKLTTADGGVVGESGITYDQNGNPTSQTAVLTTQSWTGHSYEVGSVDQMAQDPAIVSSLWSWLGGNPGGTGTAGRPWYFILIWQNDFTFTPYNPNPLPTLTTNITSSASVIKAAALKALQDAYSGLPTTVAVKEGASRGDNRATVLNEVPISSDCGDTNPNQGGLTAGFHDSEVNYVVNMEQAQTALNISIANAQDEAAALQQIALMDAIGMGIGNTAAHEIAHQFLKKCCSMDANPSKDPDAKGAYNATGCTAAADPTPWTGYWPGPPKVYIHWEKPTLTGLTQCLANGWQDYGIKQCYK
jgi:hypothetical protein